MKLQKVQSVKMENTNYRESRRPINHEMINSSRLSKCFLRDILGAINHSVFERWPHRLLSRYGFLAAMFYDKSLFHCFVTAF